MLSNAHLARISDPKRGWKYGTIRELASELLAARKALGNIAVLSDDLATLSDGVPALKHAHAMHLHIRNLARTTDTQVSEQ